MTRRTRWLALGLAIGVGAVGAYVAFVLAGGRWAAVGAVIGAVTGSFAPSVSDAFASRGDKREALRATAERPVPQSPARLLDPRRELVEFVGRKDELKELQAWCTDKSAGRLRLVTGLGGVGKTRLGVELADRMRKLGWHTERVADGQEATVIPALGDGRHHRALLVVDYAETRSGLGQMLADLAGEAGTGVRVLLLARSAGDWWDRLGIEDPTTWDQAQAARQTVIDLAPVLSADLSDADMAARAAHAFAAKLDLPVVTVDLGGSTERRRVLDLHAAALVAVLGQDSGEPVKVDFSDVLGELLRHEQHFWYNSAQAVGLTGGQSGLTQQQVRQLTAAASLLGAATEDEARALSARVPGLAPSATVADWLRALYPPGVGEAEWLGSLQPDRLAELHAIREVAASPELARACLTGLDARQALRAVTVLARASSDYPEAEDLLRQALPDVADVIAAMPASVEALTVIFNAIPLPTVVLAPAAVSLCRRILGLLPADADLDLRALWLRNLGARYSELGRPADALPVTEESVAIFRELAAASPDRYRPDLAASLSNLGVRFSALGRPADALSVTAESVAIFRELTAASPDRYRPDLARSLSNLGVRSSELGRPADALSVTEEAVAIRRELAAASPDRYRPDLALSLSNLGETLSLLGRPADALPVTEEAVATYRELAAASPDRYRHGLAESLANLGHILSELGRSADGLPFAEESAALYRKLAAALPDRYRLSLAKSLDNLGARLLEVDRLADTLPVTEEAAAIRRELVDADPDRYRPDLVRLLTTLAAIHEELGHAAEAVAAREEATRVEDIRA